MNARHRIVLAAALTLLAAGALAALGVTVPLYAVAAITLAAVAVAAPAQSGTFRRRSTIAVPDAVHAPSTGVKDGPHPEGAMS